VAYRHGRINSSQRHSVIDGNQRIIISSIIIIGLCDDVISGGVASSVGIEISHHLNKRMA